MISFVVLSYNNAKFIRRSVESILSQTVDDFEVILVDDGSTDDSVAIAKSFNDERIKVFAYEKNRGLTPSYNEAISRSNGDFIVNLDSDDAIHPHKTAKQLSVFAGDPGLDIVGTYINLIDENDCPHINAAIIEGITNKPHDFNLVGTWIGQNNICRSSTMMRRTLHERVGHNELGMVRAPDYDLWTRALRAGCRFRVIPERLTDYRQHSRGLTYGDPKATYLELSYSLMRHLFPLIDERADYASLAKAVHWMVESEHFATLGQVQRYRLLGLALRVDPLESYQHFLDILNGTVSCDESLLAEGRRILAIQKLHRSIDDFDQLMKGVKWQAQQIENWKAAYECEAQQAKNWKAAFAYGAKKKKNLKAALNKFKNCKAAFENKFRR